MAPRPAPWWLAVLLLASPAVAFEWERRGGAALLAERPHALPQVGEGDGDRRLSGVSTPAPNACVPAAAPPSVGADADPPPPPRTDLHLDVPLLILTPILLVLLTLGAVSVLERRTRGRPWDSPK